MGIHVEVRALNAKSDTGAPVSYDFEQPRVVLGRDRSCDIVLPDASVSGQHATLRHEVGRLLVADNDSTNGTFLSNSLLSPGCERSVARGEIIRIGDFEIRAWVQAAAVFTSAQETAALARELAMQMIGGKHEDSPIPRFVDSQGRVVLELRDGAVYLAGRDPACDLYVDDNDASRRHCSMRFSFDGVIVRDEGSKNGIAVNGARSERAILRHGDSLRIGQNIFRYHDPGQELVLAAAMATDGPMQSPIDSLFEDSFDATSDGDEVAVAQEQVEESEKPSRADDTKSTLPRQSQSPPVRPRGRSYEMWVIIFAIFVLLVSIGGFIWLMQSVHVVDEPTSAHDIAYAKIA